MSARKARNGKELLYLAKRLRAGEPISTEDREFLAGELERMAEKRGPGRPKRPPLERALRKIHRRNVANVADAICDGTFSEDYAPQLALSIKQAKGKRTEADAVAADIFGKDNSVRSIQATRKATSEVHPITRDEWEEFKAYLRFSTRR